jgi:hypothetical protein
MLPDPLHPAIVHFPIVFMILLPIVLGGALWMIKRGAEARRTWILPVVAAAVLAGSAWLSAQTGEAQEEKVEGVVPEGAFETHEDGANRFVLLSLGVLAITAVGLAKGKVGSVARGAALAGAIGLMGAGYQVGHSGGALVYRHGAAGAYTADQSSPIREPRESHRRELPRGDDDDGR